MKKIRTKKADAKVFKPLHQEELRVITGGELAFPFIQQAMQGSISSGQ
jgi:hypothetical protein